LPSFDGCQAPKAMKKANVLTTEIAFKMGKFALFMGRQGLKDLANYPSPQTFQILNKESSSVNFSVNRN
jgi:hypothetical protein